MQKPILSVAQDARRGGWWRVILLMCVATDLSVAEPPVLPPSQAVSSSRQFIVYADSPLRASAVCAFAEGVKRAWARELQVSPDVCVTPVVMVVSRREHPGDETTRNVSIDVAMTSGRPTYRVQCVEPPLLTEDALMPVLARAFNADLVRAGEADPRMATKALAGVPWWMSTGLADTMAGDTEGLRGWVKKSLDAGRVLTVADILGSDTMPGMAVDRERYRAHAWLLTQSLLGLPGGPGKFASYMRVMVSGATWDQAVREVYGAQFADRVTMEKWWALQVVYRSSAISARNLTRDETVTRLDDINRLVMLRLDDMDREVGRFTVSIEDWWRYHDAGWFKPMLSERMAQLTLLRSQGHPLYEPVMARYAEALNWLFKGNINRFRRAQRGASTARAQVDRWFDEINRHMDTVEQSELPGTSDNLFRGFFDALREFDDDEKHRRDPVGDYLDRFDH